MQIVDPRKSLAMKNYTDPTSETFGNVTRSMVKAGYEESYAKTIHGRKPEWLTEVVQDTVDMVRSAEKNLHRYSTMQINVDDKNAIDWARLQVDVSKFIAKTLASKKYSDDKEAEVPNVQINIVNYGVKHEEKVEPIDVDVK